MHENLKLRKIVHYLNGVLPGITKKERERAREKEPKMWESLKLRNFESGLYCTQISAFIVSVLMKGCNTCNT
jgi:hypothetical protein